MQNGTIKNGSSNNSNSENHINPKSISSPAKDETSVRTPTSVIVATFFLIILSYFTCPEDLQPKGKPTVQHVFYYGWISAISTGLGVIPLIFAPNLDHFWIGSSNAIAAGMMTAASYSLVIEGCAFDEPDDTSKITSTTRTLIGIVLGVLFILRTKSFLEEHEDLKVGDLGGADARKVFLIVFVMTLHSFSEGVGIGVSFGGQRGSELGLFITASLSVHNIPEGLAVAIALLPRKVSKLSAALWCIMTSIPQPLMAVPAYLFVDYFIPILPVGLGFASGAMAWVAFCELLVEAYEDAGLLTTALVSSLSLGVMLYITEAIDDSSRT